MRSRLPCPGLLVAATLGIVSLFAGCGGGSASTTAANRLEGGDLPAPLAGKQAPAFALRDARDGVLKSSSLGGKPYAVTFLYTQCPDVCPLIAQELRTALRQLGPQAKEVAVVAVSVDPRGDTPGATVRWLGRNRLPANFHYLVGSRQQLQPLWKAYYAAPQNAGRPQTSGHTAVIWFVDRAGRWQAKLSAGVPVSPADIAANLRTLLG